MNRAKSAQLKIGGIDKKRIDKNRESVYLVLNSRHVAGQ